MLAWRHTKQSTGTAGRYSDIPERGREDEDVGGRLGGKVLIPPKAKLKCRRCCGVDVVDVSVRW